MQTKIKQNNIFKVLKNNIQLKYDNIRQEYENNQIKKMEQNTTTPAYKKKDAHIGFVNNMIWERIYELVIQIEIIHCSLQCMLYNTAYNSYTFYYV